MISAAKRLITCLALIGLGYYPGLAVAQPSGVTLRQVSVAHVWEKVEIPLRAQTVHANPYTEVLVWVDLKGPGFD